MYVFLHLQIDFILTFESPTYDINTKNLYQQAVLKLQYPGEYNVSKIFPFVVYVNGTDITATGES